jgi:hypothetical protein
LAAPTVSTHGERQGILQVRLVDAGGDREIDDADVVGGAVRDRVVDRRDHVARVAVAADVERFQHDEVRAGRDAGAQAVGVAAAAGDDAGDVRAVAVVVVGFGLSAPCRDEVGEMRDPAFEVVVPRGDARIDGRDADAPSVEAETIRDPAGPDRRGCVLKRAADGPIEADRGDLRLARQPLEGGVGDSRDLAAEPRDEASRDAVDGVNQRPRRFPVDGTNDHARGRPRGAKGLGSPRARPEGGIQLLVAGAIGGGGAAGTEGQHDTHSHEDSSHHSGSCGTGSRLQGICRGCARLARSN